LLEHLRVGGAQSIKELAEPLSISRQGVTKHLGVLREAGLVRTEWQGRERVHRLSAEPLREVDEWLRPYEEEWDRRLDRLKKHLGEEKE
jgi:DNA-binding transcriptional ArsR family regulator